MDWLQKHYEHLSTTQLQLEHSEIQKRIEENDGRLTTDSSASLDYDLDKLEAVNIILANR